MLLMLSLFLVCIYMYVVVQTFEFQDEVGEVVLRVCKVKIVYV